MWKCHQCGAENGDGGEFCATCGNRRAANAAGSAPEPAARPERTSAYNERSCAEARQLETWGQVVFVVGIVLAAIVFLGSMAGGCAAAEESYRSAQAGIMIGAFFGGALGGAGCVLGGFLFRLVLRAFAIITEAHYRKLRDR